MHGWMADTLLRCATFYKRTTELWHFSEFRCENSLGFSCYPVKGRSCNWLLVEINTCHMWHKSSSKDDQDGRSWHELVTTVKARAWMTFISLRWIVSTKLHPIKFGKKKTENYTVKLASARHVGKCPPYKVSKLNLQSREAALRFGPPAKAWANTNGLCVYIMLLMWNISNRHSTRP